MTASTVATSGTTRRVVGLLGEKVGMTQVWDAENRVVPVTVIAAGPCVVTQVRTPETDGYDAVQIAYGAVAPRKVTKPQAGHFAKAGVTPRRHVIELRTSDASEYTLGQELTAEVFEPGQVVDVVGTSKGKGFAGVMKRHGFGGGRATHGSMFHRAPGSIGQSATPSRVFKGMRGPGQMGAKRRTQKNVKIVKVDAENHLLLIRGAVPGPNGGMLVVRETNKVG